MRPIAEFIAVLRCSFFTGAAVYVNLVEQYYLQRNLRAGAFETYMLRTTLRVALTPKEDRGMP